MMGEGFVGWRDDVYRLVLVNSIFLIFGRVWNRNKAKREGRARRRAFKSWSFLLCSPILNIRSVSYLNRRLTYTPNTRIRSFRQYDISVSGVGAILILDYFSSNRAKRHEA